MTTLVDAGLVAKAWVSTLGMLALQGTVLALVAFALTRAGRLRPAWQAAIWLVVTVKLALPWGPGMPWSLADVIASLSADADPIAPVVVTTPLAQLTRVEPTAWPAVGWLALAVLWGGGSCSCSCAPCSPSARGSVPHARPSRRRRGASTVPRVGARCA